MPSVKGENLEVLHKRSKKPEAWDLLPGYFFWLKGIVNPAVAKAATLTGSRFAKVSGGVR